jgi:segregation and condensation protein A
MTGIEGHPAPVSESDASASAASGEFSVQTPLFSGPFRLLADLILDQRMDVCDIPVSRITDLYLQRGQDLVDGWDLEEATWFLAVCALLLEMKVGRLLPRPGGPEDEQDLTGGVSPDLVYARSLELVAFRRVAADLAGRMEEAGRSLPRNAGPPPEFAHLYPDPMERVSVEMLQGIAAELLLRPQIVDLTHLAPIRVSLAEEVATVETRLSEQPRAMFRELLGDCDERIQVVVRFLAILELYREGKVELSQAGVFGDIQVEWRGR